MAQHHRPHSICSASLQVHDRPSTTQPYLEGELSTSAIFIERKNVEPLTLGLDSTVRPPQRAMAAHQAMRFGRANKALTRFCIGTSIGVFGAWNYSERGLTYRVLDNTVSRMKMLSVLPKSAQLPTPESVRLRLVKYFVHDTRDPDNYASYIGSAFSHKAPLHLAFNMIAWTNFASCLYFLPTPHYTVLILGGAIASGAAFQYQHRGVPAAGLGASGIVSGLASCVTMFMPMARASMFGLIPAPLFVWTLGYFFLDTYFMGSGINTGIGHSAHLGGAAFGAVYYALFLRKWGGILSRVR